MKTKNKSVYISLITVELFIPLTQSLKEKRSVVKGLRDRVRARFNASVAELGYHDKWQRAVIGVCMISGDRKKLEIDMARLRHVCEEEARIEITDIRQEWL